MLKPILRYVAVFLAFGSISQLQATPLIDFSTQSDGFVWFGNTSGCGNGCNLGYGFFVNGSVTVNGLGVFDDNSDGLNNSHQAGLWTSAGTLLASGTVAAGTVGIDGVAGGIGGFAWTSITDLILNTGNYVVSAFYGVGTQDRVVFNAGGIFSNDIAASFINGRFLNSGSFAMPTSIAGSDRYFGPSLRIADVPEPATLLLLSLGMVGLSLSRRKRRN